MHHMVENRLLTKCQHAFIKGHSCVTQLLAVLDKWTEALDMGNNIDAVYLDFARAFDSVPHQRLLMKIKGYGISGKIWKWTEKSASSRQWREVTGSACSEWNHSR